MSHSVFKEFPATTTTTNNNNNIGSSAAPAPLTPTNDSRDNVVIVLNKDGSVSVDQHALHTFLRKSEKSANQRRLFYLISLLFLIIRRRPGQDSGERGARAVADAQPGGGAARTGPDQR